MAVGGYGRGEMALHSDVDIAFVTPWKPTGWTETAIEAILYLLWDLGLKVGHSTRTRRRGDPRRRGATIRSAPRSSRRATSGATRRSSTRSRRASGRRSSPATSPPSSRRSSTSATRATGGWATAATSSSPTSRKARAACATSTRSSGSANMPIGCASVAELVEVGLLSADGAAPVPARRALPLGGALPPPSRRRPRRGAADLRLSARDRGADELCRPARQIAGRALHAPLFPAREDGRRPDRRLPRPSRREVRRARAPHRPARLPPPARASSKASCSTAAGSPFPTTTFFAEDPVRLIQHVRARRPPRARNPSAGDARRRPQRQADRRRRCAPIPRANALFLDVLTSPRDPETVLRWMNEAGVFGRFIPDFGRVVAQMQFDMYHHYTVDEHSIRAIGLLSRIERGELKEDHPLATALVPADRLAPRALCRGAAPRHRQGPRRRP